MWGYDRATRTRVSEREREGKDARGADPKPLERKKERGFRSFGLKL